MYRVPENPTPEQIRQVACNLAEIIDNSLAGILLIDDDAHILFANRALGNFLELNREEIVGKKITAYLQPEEAEVFSRLQVQLKSNPSGQFRSMVLDRKEKDQCIEVYYRRPQGENQPTYFYFRDITKRSQVEQQLRERNAFLDGLIESSVDGIIAADMKGNIILFNKGAQNLLGYTEQEAIENLHTTGLYVAGTAHEIMRKMRSEEFGGTGKCLKHQLLALTKDGEEIPISLSGGIIYDRDGVEVASFGIFTDLRQTIRMRKELQEKQMELIQSEKMASLGKLAAGVAHEINNPLSGVLIYANLVLEELPEDSPLHEDLKRVVSETTRCKTIVRELLDFARQEDASCEASDINLIIKEGIHLIRNQSVFHNVEIVLDLQPDLPPAYASAVRINQVILNLTLNAAEAMGGSGTLTISTRTAKEGKKFQIRVSDTGSGISPEIQSKIFDPFFTTKDPGKGTGLGLSVTYRILRDCGGTIEVESEPGRGTTFIIELMTHQEGMDQQQAERQ